jgi:hypothetical protein
MGMSHAIGNSNTVPVPETAGLHKSMHGKESAIARFCMDTSVHGKVEDTPWQRWRRLC